MTYKELKDAIAGFNEEQLNHDVTIYVSGEDEYYSLVDDYPLCESENDVLDAGHMYLVI